MKKIALLATCLWATAVVSYAQGTVNFSNAGGTFASPVYQADGTTKLSGSTYMAELLAGPDASSLAVVGAAAPFLTGGGAGFFNGGVITIATVVPGATGTFQVRAWSTAAGATFAAAQASGQGYGLSNVFTGPTGGVGSPPSSPTSLTGLQSFNLVVPEPSTIALGVLGGLALLLRRRK